MQIPLNPPFSKGETSPFKKGKGACIIRAALSLFVIPNLVSYERRVAIPYDFGESGLDTGLIGNPENVPDYINLDSRFHGNDDF